MSLCGTKRNVCHKMYVLDPQPQPVLFSGRYSHYQKITVIYIFMQKILTEFFIHAVQYMFLSTNATYFIILYFLVHKILIFYIHKALKFKCPAQGQNGEYS